MSSETVSASVAATMNLTTVCQALNYQQVNKTTVSLAQLGKQPCSKVTQCPVVVNVGSQTQLSTDYAGHQCWNQLMKLSTVHSIYPINSLAYASHIEQAINLSHYWNIYGKKFSVRKLSAKQIWCLVTDGITK